MNDDEKNPDNETPNTDAPEASAETDNTPAGSGDGAGQDSGNDPVTDTPEASADADPAAEPKAFDAEYVGKLRQEAAGYRTRAKELEAKLHRLMVENTGALADPADLEFSAEHLESPEALQAAIDELLAARPHLKARRFEPGAAAQGPRRAASGSVDLAALMRGAVT